MTKYSEIEVQTAKNLLKEGYKWIVRYEIGRLIALSEKPIKSNNNLWTTTGNSVCVGRFVPIFQSIRSDDKDPVSLESIVHPQILDDVERRYLSAVIKPFRNDVTEIRKRICKPYEYLRINGRFNNGINYFSLPNFDAGTMYKGMEIDRAYTPKELGL